MIGGLLISAALDACESHGGAANFPAGCNEGDHLHWGPVLRFPSRKGAGSGARGGASLDWLAGRAGAPGGLAGRASEDKYAPLWRVNTYRVYSSDG